MTPVSVVIPVFNGAATVAEAITSALRQTYGPLELIVVNDGSTDATSAVVARYSDRLKLIEQPNAGIAAARNAGAKASRGEYLAFLDCDDRWQPDMIARTAAALDADPRCAMAYCNLTVADSGGRSLGTTVVGPGFAHAPGLDQMLKRLWPIMPSAVLMRRTAYAACGGFPEQFRSYGYEDAYFWMQMRECGHFHYLAEPLGMWRFALFPRPLKRTGMNRHAGDLFVRLVRERYGVDATPLVRSRLRASRSILGYIGLTALNAGDPLAARRAFLNALRMDPSRVKNYLRLVRTFLPPGLARALSGRTRANAN
ncbi:MAG: glycosyltransferase family 2 protein [Candidatus Binataceae bacterium]